MKVLKIKDTKSGIKNQKNPKKKFKKELLVGKSKRMQ